MAIFLRNEKFSITELGDDTVQIITETSNKQLMMPTLKCAKVLTRETWRSSSEKNSAMNFLRVWGPCGMSVPGTELQYYGNNLEASEEQISAYICVFLYIFIRCRNNYNKKYFLNNYVSYLFHKQTCYLNLYLYPGTLQMWWCAGNYNCFKSQNIGLRGSIVAITQTFNQIIINQINQIQIRRTRERLEPAVKDDFLWGGCCQRENFHQRKYK